MNRFHLDGFSIIPVLFIIGMGLLMECTRQRPKTLSQDEILEKGSVLFSTYGCFVCHSLDGADMYGPALDQIYMKDILVIRSGELLKVKVDRDYLKRSILQPDVEKDSAFFDKTMPVPVINEEDVHMLVDYIIALDSLNKEKVQR